MGLANIDRIVDQLLAGGQSKDTPCMVVQGATTGSQQILDSKLSSVVEDCRRERLKPPALLVISDLAQHRTPGFKDPMPLEGKRILTLCCAQEVEAVGADLRRAGAEPLPYPSFIADSFVDAEGWKRFPEFAKSEGWILFSNGMHVRAFMKALLQHGYDARSLANLSIAACNHRIASVLLENNIQPDRVLESEELLRGKNLLVFSEEKGISAESLFHIKLFQAKPAQWEEHLKQNLRDNPPDMILFRNRQEVDGFVSVLGTQAEELAKSSKLIAASDEAAAALLKHGWEFSKEEII
jgi:uroporphyrinogen III methyltransferase/synthase